jgi:hypothetical protein
MVPYPSKLKDKEIKRTLMFGIRYSGTAYRVLLNR